MRQTFITLNNGCVIPQFGLGVYMVKGDALAERVCTDALAIGYRHIDTAHAYQNERGVGAAVKKSGIPREKIWITSKLWPSEYGRDKTLDAIDKMLSRLDTDYIDLLLLHQQFGDYRSAWRDMEIAVAMGKIRTIGLSNFESERLEDILAISQIKPAVVQVECHPYYQQYELKRKISSCHTAIESWYPIGHGNSKLIREPLFTRLACKYGKSNVQIILRWHIQERHIVFPKSENPDHLRENMDIFDFSLTASEMQAIRELDRGERFFNMSFAEQEKILGTFIPAD